MVASRFLTLVLLGLAAAACATNPYLERYTLRTTQEERELLSRRDPVAAAAIYDTKESMRQDPANPDSIVRLTRSYTQLAEGIGTPEDELYQYGVEAAAYELKLYKARGGVFTPLVIAETGRNLLLRGHHCTAWKWLEKGVATDGTLAGDYGTALARSRARCQGQEAEPKAK